MKSIFSRFLEVQHQLQCSEKVDTNTMENHFFTNKIDQELEKKFSQTGAYKNLKKMLASKNDTIKELRRKLNKYEPNDELKEED